MIKLSKRLQQIADFVPPGTKVADIGTDHALLPSFLVTEQICPMVIATDVHKCPLEIAKKQIGNLELTDRVALRLGDGLAPLQPGEVQNIIIAGMGGATIKDILDNNPDIVQGLERLILQPNIAAQVVRSWALENHWEIIDEELVYEDGRYYEVIVLEPGITEVDDPLDLILGPKLLEKRHHYLVPYLKSQWVKEKELLSSLEKLDREETQKKVRASREQWAKIRQVISCQLKSKI